MAMESTFSSPNRPVLRPYTMQRQLEGAFLASKHAQLIAMKASSLGNVTRNMASSFMGSVLPEVQRGVASWFTEELPSTPVRSAPVRSPRSSSADVLRSRAKQRIEAPPQAVRASTAAISFDEALQLSKQVTESPSRSGRTSPHRPFRMSTVNSGGRTPTLPTGQDTPGPGSSASVAAASPGRSNRKSSGVVSPRPLPGVQAAVSASFSLSRGRPTSPHEGVTDHKLNEERRQLSPYDSGRPDDAMHSPVRQDVSLQKGDRSRASSSSPGRPSSRRRASITASPVPVLQTAGPVDAAEPLRQAAGPLSAPSQSISIPISLHASGRRGRGSLLIHKPPLLGVATASMVSAEVASRTRNRIERRGHSQSAILSSSTEGTHVVSDAAAIATPLKPSPPLSKGLKAVVPITSLSPEREPEVASIPREQAVISNPAPVQGAGRTSSGALRAAPEPSVDLPSLSVQVESEDMSCASLRSTSSSPSQAARGVARSSKRVQSPPKVTAEVDSTEHRVRPQSPQGTRAPQPSPLPAQALGPAHGSHSRPTGVDVLSGPSVSLPSLADPDAALHTTSAGQPVGGTAPTMPVSTQEGTAPVQGKPKPSRAMRLGLDIQQQLSSVATSDYQPRLLTQSVHASASYTRPTSPPTAPRQSVPATQQADKVLNVPTGPGKQDKPKPGRSSVDQAYVGQSVPNPAITLMSAAYAPAASVQPLHVSSTPATRVQSPNRPELLYAPPGPVVVSPVHSRLESGAGLGVAASAYAMPPAGYGRALLQAITSDARTGGSLVSTVARGRASSVGQSVGISSGLVPPVQLYDNQVSKDSPAVSRSRSVSAARTAASTVSVSPSSTVRYSPMDAVHPSADGSLSKSARAGIWHARREQSSGSPHATLFDLAASDMGSWLPSTGAARVHVHLVRRGSEGSPQPSVSMPADRIGPGPSQPARVRGPASARVKALSQAVAALSSNAAAFQQEVMVLRRRAM